MTFEEYTDMVNGKVYSYIEDDFTIEEDKKTDPLESGVYVFYLKGDTNHANGVLSYGVSTDSSGQGMTWLGMVAMFPIIGLLFFLIYGMIADARFAKKGT